MELVELVSPHVAVPVIGVVICAIMVFAFGFRSPVQPPSFDFEEDESKRIKRRSKTSKVKGSTNGNIVQNEITSSEASKSTTQMNKEKKLNSQSPKAKATESKIATSKKENKQESKQEKKVKKQTGKDLPKAVPVVPEKKEVEDDGEWTTIQVSKKGKKQKTVTKKDESQAEAAMAPVIDADSSPTPHAAAAAASHAPEVEEPKSPHTDKGKKKKKEQQMEVKKKKNKREKKPNGSAPLDAEGAAASASESLPQDATPASGKTVKKEVSAVIIPDVAENVADISQPTVKKKKGKGKDNVENVIQMAETIKSSDYQKHETSEQTWPETTTSDVKAANEDTILPTNSDKIPYSLESGTGPSDTANAGISFDEMGDSWIEAAPKSKKKKSRRDN